MKLEVRATETTAKVEKGTWEEAEATIDSFAAHIYDSIWLAYKTPPEAIQRGRRKKRPSNSRQTPGKPKGPRLPTTDSGARQCQEGVACTPRKDEKAQQGQQGEG